MAAGVLLCTLAIGRGDGVRLVPTLPPWVWGGGGEAGLQGPSLCRVGEDAGPRKPAVPLAASACTLQAAWGGDIPDIRTLRPETEVVQGDSRPGPKYTGEMAPHAYWVSPITLSSRLPRPDRERRRAARARFERIPLWGVLWLRASAASGARAQQPAVGWSSGGKRRDTPGGSQPAGAVAPGAGGVGVWRLAALATQRGAPSCW